MRRRRARALAVVEVHAAALFLDGKALAPLLAGERQVEGVRRLLHLLQHRQRGRHVGQRRVERLVGGQGLEHHFATLNKDAAFVQKKQSLGFVPVDIGYDKLPAFIAERTQQYRDLAKRAGLTE